MDTLFGKNVRKGIDRSYDKFKDIVSKTLFIRLVCHNTNRNKTRKRKHTIKVICEDPKVCLKMEKKCRITRERRVKEADK